MYEGKNVFTDPEDIVELNEESSYILNIVRKIDKVVIDPLFKDAGLETSSFSQNMDSVAMADGGIGFTEEDIKKRELHIKLGYDMENTMKFISACFEFYGGRDVEDNRGMNFRGIGLPSVTPGHAINQTMVNNIVEKNHVFIRELLNGIDLDNKNSIFEKVLEPFHETMKNKTSWYCLDYMDTGGLKVCARDYGGPLYQTVTMRTKARKLLKQKLEEDSNFMEKSKEKFTLLFGGPPSSEDIERMYVDPTGGEITALVKKSKNKQLLRYTHPNPLYEHPEKFKRLIKEKGTAITKSVYSLCEELFSIVMNSKNEVEDESKVLTKRELIERVSVLHNMHLTEEDINILMMSTKKQWIYELLIQYNCRNSSVR